MTLKKSASHKKWLLANYAFAGCSLFIISACFVFRNSYPLITLIIGIPLLSYKFSLYVKKYEALNDEIHKIQKMAKIGNWVFNLETKRMSWSSEHYRIFGIEESKVPQDLYQIYRKNIHPEDLIKLDNAFEQIMKTGESASFNCRIFNKSGVLKYVRFNGAVSKKNMDGAISFITGTTQDLTESEERFNNKINTILEMKDLIQSIDQAISISDVFENLTHNVLTAVTLNGQWAVACYWDVAGQDGQPVLLNIHALEPERFQEFFEITKQMRFRYGEDLPGRVQTNLEPSWIPSLSADGNFPRRFFALSDGLQGAMAFPVTVNGELTGVIEVFSENLLVPVESLNFDFKAIGMRVGQAIEKLKTEKQVRREQKKFQALLSGLNESSIVSIANSKGEITFVNNKFVEVSGYTREELIGANHRIVSSGVHSRQFFGEMWATILEGKIWQGEVCNRKKDGSLYWVSTVITANKDELGNNQFMSIRFDITEQKNIQNKLRESDQLWRFALDAAGDGVWDWHIAENKVNFSKKWKEMLGFAEDEISDDINEWKSRVHPDDLAKVMADLESHFKYKTSFQNEHRIMCKDGSYKWILDRGTVLGRADDGTPLRMVGTQTDIGRIKNAEQQLVQASKLASLGEMSAGIAHEINNPLAIISGSVGVLSKFADNPEKFDAIVEKVQKSTERISRIVSGLKKFSRSSEGGNYKSHVLANIAREALVLTETKSIHNNTPVTCDIKSEAPILCDEVEIEQVLINLINNSIDAVRDREEKWVKVEITDDEESVILKVSDSGPGIPEKIRVKLFDPFFTTKIVGEGTGLGLSITKGIIDGHKASIRVVPDAPTTCFEVRFNKVKMVQAA